MFNFEVLFGYVAFMTSLIGLLPQVYKTYLTKSTADLSALMLANYVLCSIAWIVYGCYQNSKVVLFSNVVGLIISLISIGQKYYYDARKV
jgi:MtN3 and saliva related transmembrane protein